MKKNFRRIPTTLLISITLPVYATTYYISPTGNDTNSGTSVTSAWKTTANINTKNFKGDTILFQGGQTFTGGLSFTATDIGTASKPIVISSFGTGRATVRSDSLTHGFFAYNAAGFKINHINFKGPGRTKSARSGIIFYMDQDSRLLSFIQVNNVEVSGYKYSGISIGSWKNIGGYRDISIRNCVIHDNGLDGISTYAQVPYVHQKVYIGFNKVYNNTGIADNATGNSGSGIVLGGVNGGTVQFCSVYNNGALHSNSDGGPVGIWAYESNKVIIQYNESHHNKTNASKDGGGFDLDGGCTNSIIQYNYSHDNDGPGYMIAQYSEAPVSKNNIIRFNISENDARKNNYAAIFIWSDSWNINIQGAQIYNNTVYISSTESNTPGAFCAKSGGMSGIDVRNNIFQTSGSAKLISVPYPQGIAMQGNNYWPGVSPFSIDWGATTYGSLSSWRTATGQEKLNGQPTGYRADPLYSDTTKGATYNNAAALARLAGYRLSTNSRLLDKGLDLNTLFGLYVGSRDYWGNSIAGKTYCNIGAYQGTAVAIPFSATEKRNAADIDEELAIGVYPNPISANSNLEFSASLHGRTQVDLFNMDGRLVCKLFEGELLIGSPRKILINASSLPKGIYIVSVTNKDKIYRKRIIKL